jgi:hypothetical protein
MKAIIPVLWDYLFYICFVKSVILPYRENILKIIAKQLHLDYCLHDEDNSIKTYLKDFQLIKTGGFINGVLNKKKDLDFELKIFDWYSGSSTFPQITTCYFINSKALGLPELYLRPETNFHRAMQFFGFDDINFEFNPAFSDNYQLTGPDENHIRKFMNYKVVKIFKKRKMYTLEALNYYFLFYVKNKTLDHAELFKLQRDCQKLIKYFKSIAKEA